MYNTMLRVLVVPFLLACVGLWWGPHVANAAVATKPKCSREFESCYFRDCCDGDYGDDLTCVQGGTGMVLYINKNSTCYSDRSLALATKSNTEKFNMLLKFYEELVPPEHRKSTDQIQKMFDKHQNAFPQLVKRMEHRYKMSFIGPDESGGGEL